MKSLRSLLCLGVIVWAAGCGSSNGGNTPDASSVSCTPAPSGLPAPYCTNLPAVAASNVSGVWAIRALATQVVTAPIVGALHPRSLFYMLVTLTQSGTNVVADGRYCDRGEIDQPCSLATVVLPDAWAHSEKTFHRTGTLAPDAVGSAVLSFPTLVELAGAVPGPDTDALPTGPDDPRVLDEDHDGNPGITINLVGAVSGSLYVAQRQVTSITAIPVTPDRFEGSLEFSSVQKLLGGTPATLTGLYSQAFSSPDTTACASTFTMVKLGDLPASGDIDGGTIDGGSPAGAVTPTCEWFRSQEATLFP